MTFKQPLGSIKHLIMLCNQKSLYFIPTDYALQTVHNHWMVRRDTSVWYTKYREFLPAGSYILYTFFRVMV